MASSPPYQLQNHNNDGTLRYKVAIVMLLYLQAMSMIWTSSRLFGGDCNNHNNLLVEQQELAVLLPQHRPPPIDCNKTSSSSSSSIIVTQDAIRPTLTNSNDNEPCSILMNKFHEINTRFRQQQGASSSSSYANVDQQPYFNYAYYSGQGFGRLVDHSSMHCILALHLGRPCLLDLSTRDPFFTWRSFIHTGTYDWEMQQQPDTSLEEYYREEIDRAVSELKNIGEGSWDKGIQNVSSYQKLYLLNDVPTTWPEKGKLLVSDFYQNIASWQPTVQPKAILSPNWGMWFPRLEVPYKAQGCKLPELLTQMQNALWQPTPLTLHLHKLRCDNYLSDKDDDDKNQKNHPQAKAAPAPAVTEPYGAIHIRTFFLKQAHGEAGMQQLQPTLEKCLENIVTRRKFNMSHIKKWWILADKHPVAISLSTNISAFDIRHGYDDETFVANNAHSRMPSAQDRLAHQLMAPSVLDWTVLHQSQVALITSGSFGISGARGRGKQKRQICGDFFEVYY